MADFLDALSTSLQAVGPRSFGEVATARREDREAKQVSNLLAELQQQAQQPGFNPATSEQFRSLSVLSPEKAASISENFRGLDNRRKGAMFQDMMKARFQLEDNPEQAANTLRNRVAEIQRLGGDPSQTAYILQLLDENKVNQAKSALDAINKTSIAAGLYSPEGTLYEDKNAQAMEMLKIQARQSELEQRKKEQDFREQKLSAYMEKTLDSTQTAAAQAARNQRSYKTLAEDLRKNSEAISSGVVGSWEEFVKDVMGNQDYITELKKRYNTIRVSEAISNLPPGVASDKDIELALSPFPDENASPEYIANWLDAQSELARADEIYNRFKSNYITENRNTSGLLREWNKTYESDRPELAGKKITNYDIYETAINNNMTPEEVKQMMGISDG